MELGVYKLAPRDANYELVRLALYDFEKECFSATSEPYIVQNLPADPTPQDLRDRYSGILSWKCLAEPSEIDRRVVVSEPSQTYTQADVQADPIATRREMVEAVNQYEQTGKFPEGFVDNDYEPRSFDDNDG